MSELDLILDGQDQDAIQLPEADGLPETIAKDYRNLKLAVVDITVTDETAVEATEYTKNLATLKKTLDAEKKSILQPLKDAVAKAEEPFKRIGAELEKLDGMLRRKILEYNQAVRAREQARLEAERAAQQRALEQEAAKAILAGKVEDAKAIAQAADYTEKQVVVAPKASVKAPTATASVVTRWKYEVINPDLVPREFCEPAPGKLNKAVQGGTRSIPGVRIYSEESLGIR